MLCPHCRAENPDDAPSCARCGSPFSSFDEGVTLDGTGAAPGAAPAARRPATAAGVATPPSGTTPPTPGSWPSGGFALEPGADLGPRYRIESLLGEGGMGTVYKAYDKDLGRIVALKLLRGGLMSDTGALQRFKQELLLASKISHKNILRIHDLGDVGGMKFISMAFVDGQDLHHILKKQRPLPTDRAVRIAQQLCAALEAAHAEGIVHRDLKPQNVLIDSADQVYVSDFGLAKSLEAGAAGMTRTGEFLGTPRYMSPEQVETQTVDHRSDLYALGLILYEMVTGDVPFTGTSTLQVMYQRVKQKPKNPKLLNPDLPEYLVRVILRCLEKEPAQRYQSAREILADLEGERAPSPPRSVHFALPMPTRRGWLVTAGGAALVVVLALAVPSVRNFVLRRPGGTAATLRGGIPPLSQGKYLAVLPFRVLGEQPTIGYVADGLVEALSAKLFQLKDIRTASTAAVEQARNKESLEKIARELGVNLIVQGMVQGSGDKIRITVNLEDVVGGKRLWSQEFSGVPKDLLTLEDQIYGQLVEALELKPTNEEMARAGRPTENVEAYDLYLKGRNAMRGQQDIKNVESAIRFYEDALKKEPSFALAYAGMADASLRMYSEKKDSFWSEKALGAAQQALRLNGNLPEVHFSLGSVYDATGKSSEAVTELRRALELAPNSDDGYRRLGGVYLASGRKEEAIQAFQKALEVNPYYWVNHNSLGRAYVLVGENEKALAAFHRFTELEPENAIGYENIGVVYFRQGKYNDCIPAFQKAIQLQPHFAAYSNLGTAYFYLKRYAESVQMFEKAVQMNPNQEIVVGNLADAYRWSGQKDKALPTYDRAIALAYKELQVNPRSAGSMGSLALYYAKKGDPARALEFIRRARSIDRANVGLMYEEAVAHALAGRTNEAFQSLREAFQKGYPLEEAKNDPELASLQGRPEFAGLEAEFSRKSR